MVVSVAKALLLLAVVHGIKSEDFVIRSPEVTNWGKWGTYEKCPNDTYAYGARLKWERHQGTFGDDTALNGIELLCVHPSSRNSYIKAFETITSTVGTKGIWGSIMECPSPHFMVGFQLRSEPPRLAVDDTAANNMKIVCSDGSILEGDGLRFGEWTNVQKCPINHHICAIQTQVEDCCHTDDTALNNVVMGCCPV